MNDHKFCAVAFQKIEQGKSDALRFSEYNENELNVVLVWHVSAIIDNSGFSGLFYGEIDDDPDYSRVARAFAEIGCDESFRKAINLFPQGVVPPNRDEREAAWDLVLTTHGAEADRIDCEFYDEEARREAALADYIRRHHLASDG